MSDWNRWAVLISLVLLFVTLSATFSHVHLLSELREALPWLLIGWFFICFGGCGRRARRCRRTPADPETV